MKKIIVTMTALASVCAFGELKIKSGETLAFLGDSITQQGQRNPDGYVNLVLRALAAEGVKVTPVRAGVSGNNSDDMLKRLAKDVLSKRSNVMTLSCGVNDVWHQDQKRGVSLEAYKRNVTKILDECAASNCTVVILTATMFEHKEMERHPHNVKLAKYNAWLREEAKCRGLPLADVNADMWAAHAADPDVRLTRDDVHMLFPGDLLMACGVLKALGFDAERLAVIEKKVLRPVWVLCRFDLRADVNRADYVAKTKSVLAAVRAEKGCREYRLLGDAESDWGMPQRFGARTLWMLEKWESIEALKAHLEMPHMKVFAPTVRSMRDGSTFHVLEDVCE